MASFSLQCSICPRDPTFSDVSHLLTHVASKGHLSHYFKAQVRSRKDQDVFRKLQDYDLWYLQNNIEELLSQRLMQKDSKRGSAKTVKAENLDSKPRNILHKKDDLGPSRPSVPTIGDASFDSTLPKVPFPANESPSMPVTPTAKSVPRARRAYMGQPPGWEPGSPAPKLPSLPQQGKPCRQPILHGARGKGSDGDKYQAEEPLESKSPDVHPLVQNVSPTMPKLENSHHNKSVHGPATSPFDDDTYNEDDGSNDSSRLKGVKWPGMDLFDSASPEAKRKRNQRKDSSVLALMQTNAGLVEPTEIIYFPSWELKQTRFISGEVESSPFQEKGSPHLRRNRCRATKSPSAELDKNAPCFGKKPRSRKPLQKKQKAQEHVIRNQDSTIMMEDVLSPAQAKPKRPRTRNRARALQEDDFDWSPTSGRQNTKRKDKLKVFNDKREKRAAPTSLLGPECGSTVNGRDGSKMRVEPKRTYTNYSTLISREDGNFDAAPTSEHMLRHVSTNLPRDRRSQKSYGGRTDDKENIEPIVDENGRIDSSFGHGLWYSTQRYFSVRNDGLPQFYHSMPPFMDYDSALGLNGFSQAANPLAVNYGEPLLVSNFPHFLDASNPCSTLRGEPEEESDMGVKAEFGASSGDETIDQDINGNLDFFDN